MGICDFLRRNLKYIRVIVAAGYSVGVINGIYGFMSWVDSIDVLYSFPGISTIYDGIYCYSVYYYPMGYHCGEMAKEMYELSATNPEWQCDRHIDSIDLALYDAIPTFKNLFIVLIISSVIYGIFACIHDCALIRYDLHEPSFHPTKQKEFRLFCGTIKQFKTIIAVLFNCKCNIISGTLFCILCPIWFIVILVLVIIFSLWAVLMIILDVLWMLCIYPCIDLCHVSWSSQNPLRPLRSFAYVSSSWVAISRVVMVIAAYSMSASVANGIFRTIPSMNPEECQCSCVYSIEEVDFYKFIFVTCLWMLLTAQFFWLWWQESVHLQDYYYLIQFSLPAKLTKMINPDDPTGSMISIKNASNASNSSSSSKSIIHRNKYSISNHNGSFLYKNTRYGSSHSVNMMGFDEKDDFDVIGHKKGFNKISYRWRLYIMAMVMAFLVISGATAIILIAMYNPYEYPQWVRVIMLIISAIMLLTLIGFMRYLCVYNKEKNTHVGTQTEMENISK